MNWLLPGLLAASVVWLLVFGLIPSRYAVGAPTLLGRLTSLVASLRCSCR